MARAVPFLRPVVTISMPHLLHFFYLYSKKLINIITTSTPIYDLRQVYRHVLIRR